VHGGGKCKILENPSPCTVEGRSLRILHRARWRQSLTVHGGGKCKILENPSCTVEASARSWRILHRAGGGNPSLCTVHAGESFIVHGGGKCKILENPSPCMVEASARSKTVHSARLRLLKAFQKQIRNTVRYQTFNVTCSFITSFSASKMVA